MAKKQIELGYWVVDDIKTNGPVSNNIPTELSNNLKTKIGIYSLTNNSQIYEEGEIWPRGILYKVRTLESKDGRNWKKGGIVTFGDGMAWKRFFESQGVLLKFQNRKDPAFIATLMATFDISQSKAIELIKGRVMPMTNVKKYGRDVQDIGKKIEENGTILSQKINHKPVGIQNQDGVIMQTQSLHCFMPWQIWKKLLSIQVWPNGYGELIFGDDEPYATLGFMG